MKISDPAATPRPDRHGRRDPRSDRRRRRYRADRPGCRAAAVDAAACPPGRRPPRRHGGDVPLDQRPGADPHERARGALRLGGVRAADARDGERSGRCGRASCWPRNPGAEVGFVSEAGWESITFLLSAQELAAQLAARRRETEIRLPRDVEMLQARTGARSQALRMGQAARRGGRAPPRAASTKEDRSGSRRRPSCSRSSSPPSASPKISSPATSTGVVRRRVWS